MTYRYKIVRDIEKDAWNWFEACNRVSYGVDWKQRVDSEISKNIVGRSRTEAYEFLLPYLTTRWQTDQNAIKGESFIRERFELCFDDACAKIEEITGHPLYREDFTIYLTTFPRGPYNYQQGALWMCAMWVNPIANFMHEVLHFQTIHYWRKDPSSIVSKLDDKTFETLKESLTVVLDTTLMPLIEKPDKGYEIHQELREKLYQYWANTKEFNALITYGATLVSTTSSDH